VLTVGLFPNLKKTQVDEVLHKIVSYLTERGVQAVIPYETAEIMQFSNMVCSTVPLDKIDVALSLGGDGTFMNIARNIAAKKIPVCGVNLGKLGFLTEVELSEIENALDSLIAGKYNIEERLMLEATVERLEDDSIPSTLALNDMVITKNGYSRMIRLNLFVNNVYTATYPADGLIIATPTGATAYSLSAGGPFVAPSAKVMVVTSICSHTLHSRSLVVSEDDIITITIDDTSADVVLSADGQAAVNLTPKDKIMIRKAPDCARFIRFYGKSYFDILRNKLYRGDFYNQ
jgi:NAD+ kinase